MYGNIFQRGVGMEVSDTVRTLLPFKLVASVKTEVSKFMMCFSSRIDQTNDGLNVRGSKESRMT